MSISSLRHMALLTGMLLSPAIAGASSDVTIDCWTRSEGTSHAPAGEKAVSRVFDLSKMSQLEVTRLDPQYGREVHVRGVSLQSIIATYSPEARQDLALLHFANGMVVPYPFLDAEVTARINPFIATAIRQRSDDGEDVWSTNFPDLAKKGAESRDRRPIRFAGNKVMVRSRYHPSAEGDGLKAFSPWDHIDSLTEIEFVDSAAYYRQFRAKPETVSGFAVFQGRCQFCHGGRNIGASHGWDFVEPVPAYQRRDPKGLTIHVQSREGDAPEKGLMMPAFRNLTNAEATSVWRWLKALAETPMPPYAPSAASTHPLSHN